MRLNASSEGMEKEKMIIQESINGLHLFQET